MKMIGTCQFKGQTYSVERDEHGKFFISRDGDVLEKRLTAPQALNFFLDTMDEGSIIIQLTGLES